LKILFDIFKRIKTDTWSEIETLSNSNTTV